MPERFETYIIYKRRYIITFPFFSFHMVKHDQPVRSIVHSSALNSVMQLFLWFHLSLFGNMAKVSSRLKNNLYQLGMCLSFSLVNVNVKLVNI